MLCSVHGAPLLSTFAAGSYVSMISFVRNETLVKLLIVVAR